MLKQPEVTNKLIEVEYAVTYPLNTTTISYDSNGNVKSRFSDMVWDFSSQISQINRRKTVNFNFIKNNKSELPKDYKFNREELYEKSPLKQDKQIDNEKADKF